MIERAEREFEVEAGEKVRSKAESSRIVEFARFLGVCLSSSRILDIAQKSVND